VISKGSASSLDDLIHYHAMKKSGKGELRGHTFGSFLEAKAKGEFGEYDIESDPMMKRYLVQ